MKKLAIAAAIVCAVVTSQASTLNWKTANFNQLVDHEGTAITTADGYAALMGKSGEKTGSIVLVLLDSTALYSDISKMTVLEGATGVTKGSATGTFKTGGGSAGRYGVSNALTFDHTLADIADGSKIGIMYQDVNGALSQLVYWDDANNKAGDKISTVYTVSGMAEATPDPSAWTGNAVFTTEGTSETRVKFTTQASAVPEPTSGLLLLLGIGAMALRRRRA